MEPSGYEIIRIDENTWRIEEDIVRCFLFVGTERALLLDSGRQLKHIMELIRGITPKPVILANTHSDFDHMSCNGEFEAVYMHPAEYSSYHKQKKCSVPCLPLWDGDVIDLGGRELEVITIPGHTPGSIALLDRENRVLAAGDTVQDGPVYMFGLERDLLAYLYSLEKLKRRQDAFDVVYPCHGSFPAPASILDGLIQGVRDILDGKIRGEPAEEWGIPIRVYDIGAAKILYDYDIAFPGHLHGE